MVREIVGKLAMPTRLQYAMSQRLYYEELARGELFWPQMDPEVVWLGNDGARARAAAALPACTGRSMTATVNIPTIYLMDVEDTGRIALPKDEQPLARGAGASDGAVGGGAEAA